MNKKLFTIKEVREIRRSLKTVLCNKYYNLWMTKYETDLPADVYNFLFKKFYETGTVAGFKVKHTEDLGVTTYATQEYNMYDYPEVVDLINERNSPLVPAGPKVVNKDVVIGYCQSNHKSIKFIVDKYIERILDVEMVINTQLVTHKLPFLVGINPEDVDKANDIIRKLMNDEPVIFVDLNDLNMVKTLVNGNPYILDKLVQHKQGIESELLTFLGLDNTVSNNINSNLDQVNANNNLINAFKSDIDYNIQNFVEGCKEFLGISFYLKQREPEVKSIYEEGSESLENNVHEGNRGGTGNDDTAD